MVSSVASKETVVQRFAPLFLPQAIAVVGASAKGNAQGNRFIRQLRMVGYEGAIYPIHPTERVVDNLQAYPSLAVTPEPIDYAFIAIAGERVPDLLANAHGRVRFAQVMSSGFGESAGGGELEKTLIEAARRGGARLIGPNCMGTHSPRGRLTFVDGGPDSPGTVAVMSQSGGLAIDVLQRGRSRGLEFSGIVSLGNCADLGPNDFLEYFLADTETRVIGAYIEHVSDGRRFFEQLRAAGAKKPVIILKAGRTQQGQRAAASHTGSLADNDQIWCALAKQTGAILVDTLEEFIDALVAFQNYTPRLAAPTGRVLLFGNGGGASVLATDFLAKLGLDVVPLDASTTKSLEHLALPAGASISNPIDVPANIFRKNRGELAQLILEIVAQSENTEGILMHLNVSVILGYRDVDMLTDLIEAAVRAKAKCQGRTHLMLALRSNGQPESEQRMREGRLRAMKAGIPVFDEIPNQARAMAAIHAYERFRSQHVMALA